MYNNLAEKRIALNGGIFYEILKDQTYYSSWTFWSHWLIKKTKFSSGPFCVEPYILYDLLSCSHKTIFQIPKTDTIKTSWICDSDQ